jgi:oxysterol-binding protein-related protein 9/10/11
VVEQVSHHPPITAYFIENPTHNVSLTGHNAQKTSFSAGNIIVKQVGHAVLTVKLPDGQTEEYVITLPKLRIEGIWYGSPYIELAETSYIQGSNGFLSTVRAYACDYVSLPLTNTPQIEYKGKGYFSGKSHSFKAVVSIGGNAKHTFEGQWNTTSKDNKTGKPFHDVTTAKEEVTVRPLDQQEDFESRNLWAKVAKGIREGDYETASQEKSKIEVRFYCTNSSNTS